MLSNINLQNRRKFLQSTAQKSCALAVAPTMAATFSSKVRGQEAAEPHFFLSVMAEGGLDNSYHFDSRPASMTAAGEIANYRKDLSDAVPWHRHERQGIALATAAVKPLETFRDHFSVINGVVMAPGFDGHDQNMNTLFTANPFGGASFLPKLNSFAATPHALDYIETGRSHGDIHNAGGGIPVSAAAANSLKQRLQTAPQLNPNQGLGRFIAGRMQTRAEGNGMFAAGSSQMAAAFAKTNSLSNLLRNIDAPEVEDDPLATNLGVIATFFRQGAARSATLDLEQALDSEGNMLFVDTHGIAECQQSEALVAHKIDQIAKIFDFLANQPFDSERSLLDVTTVMVASEFSRTMRQSGRSVDATGTDHNPLNNTILLGGKGIQGGQVFGASDRSAPHQVISAAHQGLDPTGVKLMGRPFDFEKMQVRTDLPEAYHGNDYITAASIGNTILDCFGIAKDQYQSAERNGGPAPVLGGILT